MLMILFIILGVATRLMPHLSQFTALLAVGLLAGIYLSYRRALVVMLVTMLITDMILGFHDTMLYTYGSMLIILGVGHFLKARKNLVNVISGSLVSAMIFFVVTNFGAWFTLYPMSFDGLRECYINAIPFFRTTVASTVAYSAVIYVAYEWMVVRLRHTSFSKLI